jgi:hypothetical protein
VPDEAVFLDSVFIDAVLIQAVFIDSVFIHAEEIGLPISNQESALQILAIGSVY